MTTIHIVDDTLDVRLVLREFCKKMGHETHEYERAEYLTRRLKKLDEDSVILLDIMMPEMDGFEALAVIREELPNVPVIMITALEDTASVLRCLRLGANDFITKPIDRVRLEASIHNARETGALTQRLRTAEASISSMPKPSDMVAKAAGMQRVLNLASKVRDSEATILITGESGTGKEVLARALHYQSKRAKEPFVAINCAAIPATLLESELFGHEAGAFTGADKRRKGKFEAAGKGTLFLDEVGEMPLESQVRFLRVLQERKVVRVGGTDEIPVEARIICATNRSLPDMMKNGEFREDLYYRINTFPIELPALRHRREDITLLSNKFLRKYAEQESKMLSGFHPDAMEALENFHWPGNVRQLENVIERAVLLCDSGEVTPDTLPTEVQKVSEMASGRHEAVRMVDDDSGSFELPISLDNVIDGREHVAATPTQELLPPDERRTARVGPGEAERGKMSTGRIEFRTPDRIVPLAKIEKSVILAALRVCKGDISETARRLEVSRGWVYRRLRSFEINPDEHRPS